MTAINAMDALSMRNSECRQFYLEGHGKWYNKIVIGAIVPKRACGPGRNPGILLLKRAAHEKIYPNVWEIPGGRVEDSDLTILDAVKREVSEETSMQVEKVIGAVKCFAYAIERELDPGDGNVHSVWSTSLQLNFICEVAKHDLVLNPDEHSEGKFVDQSEVAELEMTEQMRGVVAEAFDWMAENSDLLVSKA
ncbi:MAG: hypothetical protein LQ338_006840 [Usnochroma carphineum]|nr:MAG: hypothetical protein LQ338_006840 [Usnochroma carphineum]